MKQEIFLDASAFKDSVCLRRLAYTIVEGVRPKQNEVSLNYGTAIHKYRAVLRSTTNHEQAILAATKYYIPISMNLPDNEWRNLEHMLGTCNGYKEKVYEKDTLSALSYVDSEGNKKTLIEEKFSIRIYEDDIMILWLCGTVDEIAMMGDTSEIVIADCKTSSSFYKEEEALKMFRSSTQLMFYKYIVEKMLPDFKNIKCIIDGIFLAPKVKSKFVRSHVIDFTPKQMANFELMLQNVVNDIIKYYHLKVNSGGEFPKDFRACDSTRYNSDKVGACRLFDLCHSDVDEELYNYQLNTNYTIKPYRPLEFDMEKE